MRAKQTIVINGRHYDALTGMPLDDKEVARLTSSPAKTAKPVKKTTTTTPAKSTTAKESAKPVARAKAPTAKRSVQRSKTLRRDIVKSPIRQSASKIQRSTVAKKSVAKSPLVQKFAPHPQTKATTKPKTTSKETVAPIVAKTHARFNAKKAATNAKPVRAMSSRELREQMIKQSLQRAPASKPPVKAKAKTAPKRVKKVKTPLRVSSIVAACLGVMLLGGYLSYINMPNLSVRVAAAQAGLDAHYPGYTPSGYRFDGPVAYSNGRVSLSFEATGGQGSYTINQQRSNWDSLAVLDNYVSQQTDDFVINDTQGLTIYTYANNAVWVNRGVLYTINGDAPLKTEQVIKIAQSL